MSRLPALLFVVGFVADAMREEKAPAAVPFVSLDMHNDLCDTSMETDMMTRAISKMINTEGTMIAITMVPLLAPAGASSSVLFDIII